MEGKVFSLSVESLKQAFKRSVDRAGIENFTFHDFHHEATSQFFEKGLNTMEVAAITGHKDLQTLKRYTHLYAEDLAKTLGGCPRIAAVAKANLIESNFPII